MGRPDTFDGQFVDRHQARFPGTIDIDGEDADRLPLDTEFMAVIVCRVTAANADRVANGDLVRTNKIKISEFALVDNQELRDDLHMRLPALAADYLPPLPPWHRDQLELTYDEPSVPAPEPIPERLTEHPAPNEVTVDGETFDPDEIFTPGARQLHTVAAGDPILRRFIESGQ